MSEFSGAGAPGLWLRRQREMAGLTQGEVADRSGLSVRSISNLEHDRTRRPQAHSLRRIASALGLSEAAARELIACYRAGMDDSEFRPRVATGDEGRVPRQLPAAPAKFVGRAAELALLDQWLEGALRESGQAVVVCGIGGMAGVGKTALALHWAHRVAGRFPDGQLHVDLRGFGPASQPAEPAEVIRGFLHALGVAPEVIPAAVDGQAALYRSVLASRRMLIVADNARDATQVRPLLAGMPGSVVLVTSRRQLSGLAAADGARILHLDVLTVSDAARFLAARLGTKCVEAEPQAVEELIGLCGRLPLALAVVAARGALSGWPLAVLARQLASAEDRLEELGLDDPMSDVRAVFSWSSRQMSDEAARLFRLLAIHPGPDISVPAAASLARASASRAAGVLRELVAASLAVERVPGRYALHDLLRAYAAQQRGPAEPDEESGVAASAMIDHYLYAARGAAHVLDPAQPAPADQSAPGITVEQQFRGDQALAWFDAEREVLLAVIAQAAIAGADDRACRLASAFEPFCARRGYWTDLAATQQAALDCSGRLGDLEGQARAHLSLGRALGMLGSTESASTHVARAVELTQALGDRAAEARAHIVLANIQPDRADAIEICHRAVLLAEEAGNAALTAQACNNLGYDYALGGDPQRALAYCRRALDLCQQTSTDPALEGHVQDSLGHIYRCLGYQRQALASYTRAVRRFRAIGAPHLAAESLVRLGDCRAASGDTAAAIDAWQQALVTLDELGHPDAGQIRRKLSEHARSAGSGSR